MIEESIKILKEDLDCNDSLHDTTVKLTKVHGGDAIVYEDQSTKYVIFEKNDYWRAYKIYNMIPWREFKEIRNDSAEEFLCKGGDYRQQFSDCYMFNEIVERPTLEFIQAVDTKRFGLIHSIFELRKLSKRSFGQYIEFFPALYDVDHLLWLISYVHESIR